MSYSIELDDALPLNRFGFAVTPPAGDGRIFTCALVNAGGTGEIDLEAAGGTVKSGPLDFAMFAGTTVTARLNFRDSQRDDVVVPLVFVDDLATELNQRRIHFTWSDREIQVTSPARPLVELDPAGAPVMVSYDVPEPTSYRGRHVIQLDFGADYFVTPQQRTRRAVPVPTPSGPGPIYGDGTPIVGTETPSSRATPADLTETAISAAFAVAKQTGYFNPAVFPNVQAGNDSFSRTCVTEALAELDVTTVITQLTAGNRLTVYRDTSGRCTYRFIPVPERAAPMLLLVEYYRLSSFPARYGAGRTIKTFSLLPGERTRIRVSTYRRSTQTMQQTTSIVDSTSDDTESEFERSVLGEQSSQDNTSKSFEYHAEAEAQAHATWGWGNANVKASGGVKGSANAAREEFAKNVSTATAHNAARASSRRDVQVDTSLDVQLETGEEEAITRELANINVSRTLNFVFRQMNQEFVTLLHLVDVRVAFFNGYAESRAEVPLSDLDDLLQTYVVADKRPEVRAAIVGELGAVPDYRAQEHSEFVQTVTLTDADRRQTTRLRVNPDLMSSYQAGADGPVIHVPGIILTADSHVMRTDGVVVDTFLGRGNGLDDYSVGLQTESVRARRIENDRHQADLDRLRLATTIVSSGDTARAALYQQLFPVPQIVNQIDHAAVNNPPNGQHTPHPATA